jgi:hypothetical protein
MAAERCAGTGASYGAVVRRFVEEPGRKQPRHRFLARLALEDPLLRLPDAPVCGRSTPPFPNGFPPPAEESWEARGFVRCGFPQAPGVSLRTVYS